MQTFTELGSSIFNRSRLGMFCLSCNYLPLFFFKKKFTNAVTHTEIADLHHDKVVIYIG